MNITRKKYYTKHALINKFGFNDELIKNYLSEPMIRNECKNPDMNLFWFQDEVKRAMEDDELRSELCWNQMEKITDDERNYLKNNDNNHFGFPKPYYTKSTIKKEFFFTEDMIDNYLPVPYERKNLKNTNRPIKCWDNYVLPVIGSKPLQCVTTDELQAILDRMYYQQGYSHSLVSNLHSLIYSIFKYALEHKYIDSFYSDEFIVPRKDEDIENKLINTQKQTRGIIPENAIDLIFQRFPEGTSAFLIMAICLYTGARLGEACALAYEDCDFEKNIIHICRQMPDGTKDIVCNPKYNSVRDVPMCSTLKEILLKAKDRANENLAIWGINYCQTFLTKVKHTESHKNLHGFYEIHYDSGDTEIHFINVNERGVPVTPSVMKHASRIIHGYSSNANSPQKKEKKNPIYDDYNTHSFRHTFCSFLYANQVDPVLISAVLGHKKKGKEGMSEITSRYIHLTDLEIQSLCNTINGIYEFKV